MGKKFKDVSEMVSELSKDKKFKKETVETIKKRGLAKFLFFLRCDQKLTQKELAKKIGCSQGRVSKVESSQDEDLGVKDLLDYGNALSLQLQFGYRDKSPKRTDLIKYHAIKIKQYFDELVKLAEKDEEMIKGLAKFHIEGIFNITGMIAESLAKLKKKLPETMTKEAIHISAPLQDKLATIKQPLKAKEKVKA